ncbi:ribosome biogenesis GTPase YqeH [Salipaludibacillus sp. CUR1]|uniref:ribosome biogenesis GTPase YqeH n=1 Tax=Salipaludibacillus sp. CUR1 TaxID=2820003 RepID=UPI001E5D8E5C|nr:ribosome biogenesis GTPase YqeH [Salipaludibacillus sp. CUR1]MCE7794175.1 ribosome biogenesis GTPase YqeH [Salipaludibacillus sp. CUR1]
MGEIGREQLICSGCGVKIQTENKGELGYAPPSSLSREVIICQRCYRLKHYNEVQDVSLTDDDFLKILTELGKKEALIVKIVDIFDFEGSWLPGLHRFAGKNPVLLVGNKADLLPKSVKSSKVIQWMKKAAKDYGLKPADVHLMSAKTGDSIMEVANLIEEHRDGRDVYVVGSTNTGKSSFINRLLKEFGAEEDMLITTSNIPGTTLDMIDVPLDDGSFLYDTPGIINHHQIAHLLDKNELKVISPKKEVKPKVFQLNEAQTLFFGGLGRVDFISGEPQSFIVYMSNDLTIHRTKTEKAAELYEQHLGDMLSPPFEKNKESFPELVKKEWKVEPGKYDLIFSGLGWVTISGSGSVIRTFAPKGVNVNIRSSIF